MNTEDTQRLFRSTNLISGMDIINFMTMRGKLAILFVCVSIDRLSARSIPLEIYQSMATEEDEGSLELELQNKGEAVECVGINSHSDYCLALKPPRILSDRHSFKAYLNKNIVRNCSSSGSCTDHGALFKHTRVREASEECEGIPFANIHKNLIGQYTVIIDNPPKRLKASFNLTFCKVGKSDDMESLKIYLESSGNATDCVSPSDHESFCLQLRFAGQPVKNKTFQCFSHNRLVYGCSANGSCTAYGILQGNVRPPYVSQDCSGIPFANVIPKAVGQYSCVVEDQTRLIEAEFDLHFCNGSRVSNKTKAQAEETQAQTEETQAQTEETQAQTEETRAQTEETQAQAEETLEKNSVSNIMVPAMMVGIMIVGIGLAVGFYFKRRTQENSLDSLSRSD